MSNFRNRRLVTDAAAAKKYMLTMRLLRGIVSTILVLLFAGTSPCRCIKSSVR